MKKVPFFLFLLFMAIAGRSSAASPTVAPEKQDIIIVVDVIDRKISVIPNDYLSAQSVTIKVLDVNDNLLGAAQTTPGQTVTFNRTGQEYKVVCTYQFSNSDIYIIEDVVH